MSLYDRLRATAARMLDTVALAGMGQAVTISSRGTSTYTVATGAASYTTTTQTGSGVLLEQSEGKGTSGFGTSDTSGTLIQRGDKRLLLSPLNSAGAALTAPKVGDTVTIDSVVYRIEGVKTTAPAGTVVMYDCDLRGAS